MIETLSQFNSITGDVKIYSSYCGELIFESTIPITNGPCDFETFYALEAAIRRAEKIARRSMRQQLAGQVFTLLENAS